MRRIPRNLLQSIARAALLGIAPALLASSARGEEMLPIAFIDPLSGHAASTGEAALTTFRYLAEAINANGGVLGRKLDVIHYDNKLNAQESLVELQKAIDAGIRIVTQGTGSDIATSISQQLGNFNAHNPGREVAFLDYGAEDPELTNDNCSYWHFRWDASADISMEALTNFIKTRPAIKKVYLINQDYAFGQSVRAAARKMLSAKRPDIQIVGDEVHPLQKLTDFSPYIAKIQASGADAVITGNWAEDLALLLIAAADAGLKSEWYTYHAGGPGGPTAIKRAGLADRVFEVAEGFPNIPNKRSQQFERAFRARTGKSLLYPRAVNEMDMLVRAAEEAESAEPPKIAPKLEGMRITVLDGGEGFMRADDHQFFQPLYVANLGPLGKDQPFDEEGTGWGWKVVGRVDAEHTVVPTTCRMKRPS